MNTYYDSEIFYDTDSVLEECALIYNKSEDCIWVYYKGTNTSDVLRMFEQIGYIRYTDDQLQITWVTPRSAPVLKEEYKSDLELFNRLKYMANLQEL